VVLAAVLAAAGCVVAMRVPVLVLHRGWPGAAVFVRGRDGYPRFVPLCAAIAELYAFALACGTVGLQGSVGAICGGNGDFLEGALSGPLATFVFFRAVVAVAMRGLVRAMKRRQ
jgi:hypothetical protein